MKEKSSVEIPMYRGSGLSSHKASKDRLRGNSAPGKGREMVSDKDFWKKLFLSHQSDEIASKRLLAEFSRQFNISAGLPHRPDFGTEGPDWRAIAAWLNDDNRMPNQVTIQMFSGRPFFLTVELHPQSARQDLNWSTDYSWCDRWMFNRLNGSILMSKIPLKADWKLNESFGEWPPVPFPSSHEILREESLCENDQELAYLIWAGAAWFVMEIFYPEGKESVSPESEIPHLSELQQALWGDLRHHVRSLNEERFSLQRLPAEWSARSLKEITALLQEIPESESLYREFLVEPERRD